MQQILMLTMLICAAHYKPNDTVVNVQHKNVQQGEWNLRQRHRTKTTASSESPTHQRRSVTTTSHHNVVIATEYITRPQISSTYCEPKVTQNYKLYNHSYPVQINCHNWCNF